MSAIVVGPAPDVNVFSADPTNHMPFAIRQRLAKELNNAWYVFVTEMHDGPTTGPEVADKFWKFVTGT